MPVAVVLFAFALTEGLAGTVSVIGSLYPVTSAPRGVLRRTGSRACPEASGPGTPDHEAAVGRRSAALPER